MADEQPPPKPTAGPDWAATLRRAIAREEAGIAAEERARQAAQEAEARRAQRPRGRVTRSELFGLRAFQERMRERHEAEDDGDAPR